MKEASHKVVIVYPALTDSQKERIMQTVSQNGFRAVFCRSEEDAAAEIPDAEVYLGMDGELIRRGKKLRWVCAPSAGVGHLIGALEGTDIMLTNSSGAYGVTISEHIVMVTLELMRR